MTTHRPDPVTPRITPEMVSRTRELFASVEYVDPVDPAEEPIYDDDDDDDTEEPT